MDFGKTIKLLRVAAGINQKEAACRLNISAGYLSQIEGGGRQASAPLLHQISRLLGVPISVFFFRADDAEATLTPTQQAEYHLAKQVLDEVFQRLFARRQD